MKSSLGSKDYHIYTWEYHDSSQPRKRPDHDLRERTSQFCCELRVVVKYIESFRQKLTLRFTDTAVQTRFLDGMQKAVCQNLANTLRLRPCRMFTTCCSDRFGDRASSRVRTKGTLSELAERLGNFHESANALTNCLQTRDFIGKTGQSMVEAAKCMFSKLL